MSADSPTSRPSNFLREIIRKDIEADTYGGRVAMRFPPEPNGYPHLGHACTICLNFGMAKDFGGTCNLRYDDTNPDTERPEFVAAMEDAVRWLGFSPSKICFASDYFEQFYEWAVELIKKDLAYVDSQTGEEIRANRGTVTEPGVNSPYRDRPTEESIRLFEEMRRGEHADGSHVLRAKIDMADDNMLLRDPLMYRIRRDAHHYRRGDDWSIYPLYDWAHGQGDAIERITHSICTLEFDVHRPLYDWFLDAIGIPEPRNRQYEFARFNLDYTVTSKRKLLRLVEDGHVNGWDDPRMPTIAGQRRRGVRPEALRSFFESVGVTRVDGSTDLAFYEHAIRDDLNYVAPRVMAVSKPLQVVIDDVADGEITWIDAPFWPHDVTPPDGTSTTRRVSLTRKIWIERDDFSEEPPKGWKRLAPGEKARLRHGPIVRCTEVEKDEAGEIVAVHVETIADEPSGKVSGVIHWVSAAHALPARFRLYDRLFTEPHPDEQVDFLDALNPKSLVETNGYIEPSVADDPSDTHYQFERLGYFRQDSDDSKPDALVFNRIVGLRDSWSKQAPPSKAAGPARKIGRATRDVQPRDLAAALTESQRTRFNALLGKGVGAEESAVIAGDEELASFFEQVMDEGAAPDEAAKLLVHSLRPSLRDRSLADSKATPEALAELLAMLNQNVVTSSVAGEVVAALVRDGGRPSAIVEALGLGAVGTDTLLPVVEGVIADNPKEAERFRSGEDRLIGFFTGQVMQRAGKGADAKAVRELLLGRLNR